MLDRLRPDTGSDALKVMIVLSAPPSSNISSRSSRRRFPKDPNRRVFYLRYRPLPPPRMTFDPFGQGPVPVPAGLPADDIEHTLKSLDAKIYSSITPEEFRRALSNVISEIREDVTSPGSHETKVGQAVPPVLNALAKQSVQDVFQGCPGCSRHSAAERMLGASGL